MRAIALAAVFVAAPAAAHPVWTSAPAVVGCGQAYAVICPTPAYAPIAPVYAPPVHQPPATYTYSVTPAHRPAVRRSAPPRRTAARPSRRSAVTVSRVPAPLRAPANHARTYQAPPAGPAYAIAAPCAAGYSYSYETTCATTVAAQVAAPCVQPCAPVASWPAAPAYPTWTPPAAPPPLTAAPSGQACGWGSQIRREADGRETYTRIWLCRDAAGRWLPA